MIGVAKMFWMLFRAFCCLCSNRESLRDLKQRGNYYQYQDTSDESDEENDYVSEDDRTAKARIMKAANLKRNAIGVATDVIVAEDLLRQHGNDASLCMYHTNCTKDMHRAFDKLPPRSYGAKLKRHPNMYLEGKRYTRDFV